MANFQIKVESISANGKVRTIGTKQANLREDKTLEDFSKDVASWAVDFRKLQTRSLERGYKIQGS